MRIGTHIRNPVIHTGAQPDTAEESKEFIDERAAIESVILCLETGLEVVFENSDGDKHYMEPGRILADALSHKWEG
jgi:hypothetical protein